MKQTIQLIKATLLCSAITLVSCEKEGDNDNSPTFENLKVNELSSTSQVSITAGDTIFLTGIIKDDVELSSLNIVSSSKTQSGANTLSIDKKISYTGTSQHIDEFFVVPSNTIAGPYELTVTAEDANGGMSGDIEFDLAITNSTMPVISLITPTANATYKSNDTIVFEGTITDNDDLTKIEVTIEPQQMSGGFVAAGTTIYDESFTLSGSADTFWDFDNLNQAGNKVAIPSITTSGTYGISIYATDSDGNIAVIRRDIWLNP